MEYGILDPGYYFQDGFDAMLRKVDGLRKEVSESVIIPIYEQIYAGEESASELAWRRNELAWRMAPDRFLHFLRGPLARATTTSVAEGFSEYEFLQMLGIEMERVPFDKSTAHIEEKSVILAKEVWQKQGSALDICYEDVDGVHRTTVHAANLRSVRERACHII